MLKPAPLKSPGVAFALPLPDKQEQPAHNLKGSGMHRRVITLNLYALCIVALAVFLCTQPAHAQRLPAGVTPVHYSLTLAPDLKAASFTGDETLDVTLEHPADAITLNAAEITFQKVTITAQGSRPRSLWMRPKNRPPSTWPACCLPGQSPCTSFTPAF
jgi:hypothetical protein